MAVGNNTFSKTAEQDDSITGPTGFILFECTPFC